MKSENAKISGLILRVSIRVLKTIVIEAARKTMETMQMMYHIQESIMDSIAVICRPPLSSYEW